MMLVGKVKLSFFDALMTTSKLLILLLISGSAIGQTDKKMLKNWKSYPVPTNEDTLYKYNSDPNDWVIYLNGNEITVDKRSEYSIDSKLPFDIKPTETEQYKLRGRRRVLKVDDGYLVGFYRGEWGGNLYWFSKNGKNKYEISGHEIVQFIKRDGKIYAIEGLAHSGMSRGSIIEIEKRKGKWITKKYLKLPSAPACVQLDSKNNLVIVTPSSLLSVDAKAKIDTLISTGMWDPYLYPSSMVIQKEIVYIGMRKGVYKFNLATKKEEWLLPD